MENRSGTSIFHMLLNIISLVITFFGLLISVIILIIVYLRRKHFYDVKSLLCINNYFLVFLTGVVLLLQNFDIVRGDFGLLINQHETLGCRLRAYVFFSLLSAIYQAFILQALYRLDRIVHRSRRWFVKYRNYLLIIPIIWLISFILMSPILIRHGQKLISGEYVCLVRGDDSKNIAYSMLVIYVVPFLCIASIYFRVSLHLHKQRNSNINNNQRDIVVLRRIIIVLILLFSYGFPTTIMLIHLAITNELVSSFYRLFLFSIAGCVFTQSVTIIYITPHFRRNIFPSQQTKKIYLKNRRRSSQLKTNGTRSTSSYIFEHSFS